MTHVSSPWPFAQWGIDIMGPFPLGEKQLRFLIVLIDYFTRLALLDDYNATSKLCVEIGGQPSTKGEQVLKIKEQDEWMTPIVHYLIL